MPVKIDNQIKLNDGSTIGYAEYGDPSGKPVIHFHGTPSSRLEGNNPDLVEIAERLRIRLIVPDRPGIGLSDWRSYTIASYPEIIAQFADALNLDRFVLMGLSGGGKFVAACAWKIPQRLTSATIVSGSAPFDLPGVKDALSKEEKQEYGMADKMPWLFRLMLWKFARDARKNPEGIFSLFTVYISDSDKAWFTQPNSRRVFEQMVIEAFRQGTRPAAYDWAITARPWGFSLKEIKMPIDIWHGEDDKFVSIEQGRLLAEAIPNSHCKFYPNEGHTLIVRRFEEILNAAVSEGG